MWTFEHRVECRVDPDFAWRFWTQIENWAAVDPLLEWARISGAFAPGSRIEMKTRGGEAIESRIVEVENGSSALLETLLPGASVSFLLQFEPSPLGTRIRQRITLAGARAEEYEAQVASGFEKGVPAGMQRLADAMERAAQKP
jgi:hypothetical protein